MTKTTDDRHVEVLYYGEGQPCYLYSKITKPFDVVRIDDVFPNPTKMSAFLVDEIGYRNACYMLKDYSIPYSSKLWDLNHEGPPHDEDFFA